MLTEDQMAAWAAAIAGLLLGFVAGKMFIPSMILSASGASIMEDLPVRLAQINIALLWVFAFTVATIGYKTIKRI